MSLTERVLHYLGPAFRAAAGPLLPGLVHGLGTGMHDLDELLRPADGSPPWAPLFDLERTPFPAWLGRAVYGAVLPGGLTVEEQRAALRDRARTRRGRPATLKSAVAATLSGSRRVFLVERDTSAYKVRVQVYAAEVVDHAVTLAAAMSQKPVGLLLQLELLSGSSYAHMTAAHGPTFADWAAAFPTYQQARDHLPEA